MRPWLRWRGMATKTTVELREAHEALENLYRLEPFKNLVEPEPTERWILINLDGTGLLEIEARDEHPDRESFNDVDAYWTAFFEAQAGDAYAQRAVESHNHDLHALALYRQDNGAFWKAHRAAHGEGRVKKKAGS